MSLHRMQRILHIFVRLFFLFAIIAGVWIAAYAYKEGFTKKWRNLIMEEFEKRGIDAEIVKFFDLLNVLVSWLIFYKTFLVLEAGLYNSRGEFHPSSYTGGASGARF